MGERRLGIARRVDVFESGSNAVRSCSRSGAAGRQPGVVGSLRGAAVGNGNQKQAENLFTPRPS